MKTFACFFILVCLVTLYPISLLAIPTPTPGSATWKVREITDVSFGNLSDDPAPGDYTGDGSADITCFRSSTGMWDIREITQINFGSAGDQPVSGDYDGDGSNDIAYFRESAGLWAIWGITQVNFGGSDDQPVCGDYNGDGSDDIAYFRDSTGLWVIRGITQVSLGGSGDQPACGDYDGDGCTDIAYFRPLTGQWEIRWMTQFYFGVSGDVPVPGNYDGYPRDCIAVFRPSDGSWIVWNFTRFVFGGPGDMPVQSDYDGDGTVDAAFFGRPTPLSPTPTPAPTYPFPTPTPTPISTPTSTPWTEISTPTGLKAVPGADSVKLTWNPNPEATLDGYNVYRSTSAGGTYTKINPELVRDTEYTDSGLSVGQTFYYKLTAVNTSGTESDQTAHVSATVGAIVVWMPDYRGPAGTEVTLLINADNATGVSNSGLDIKVIYDADLLTPVTQSDPDRKTVEKTALTQSFLIFDNAASAAGQLNISGVGSGMTITGEGHLFDLKFNVQSSAGEGEWCEHTFVIVKFFDENAVALAVDYSDSAIFTVGSDYIRGDVDGDGDVDSGDAILALQIAVGLVVPTPIQLLAGDINGDGEIDSADAILILRLAVGLPVNPPGTREIELPSAGYHLTVGQAVSLPGQTLRVPISVNDAAGIAGIDLRINYDAGILTALGAYTTSLTGGFNFDYHVGSNWIDIALSAAENLSGGSGSLVELEFQINSGAVPGSVSPLTLSQKKLSGQYGENLVWDSSLTSSNGSVLVAGITVASGDYSGDLKSDVAIFRSGGGMWAVRGVTRAYLGTSGDLPVSGDYDGDGSSDIAVFRSGLWAIRGFSRVYLGTSGDLPVPGDYDGDGRCDAGIFRSGLWAIRNVTRAYLGTSGDCIASGDYDGDGSVDIGIFRNGLWALRGLSRIYLGTSGDLPVPGDYAGDGTWEPGIFRYGLWAIRNLTRAYLGTSGDLPVPADYDGLGEDDIGIFRGSAGLWAIKGVSRVYFGTGGDIPVTR